MIPGMTLHAYTEATASHRFAIWCDNPSCQNEVPGHTAEEAHANAGLVGYSAEPGGSRHVCEQCQRAAGDRQRVQQALLQARQGVAGVQAPPTQPHAAAAPPEDVLAARAQHRFVRAGVANRAPVHKPNLGSTLPDVTATAKEELERMKQHRAETEAAEHLRGQSLDVAKAQEAIAAMDALIATAELQRA